MIQTHYTPGGAIAAAIASAPAVPARPDLIDTTAASHSKAQIEAELDAAQVPAWVADNV